MYSWHASLSNQVLVNRPNRPADPSDMVSLLEVRREPRLSFLCSTEVGRYSHTSSPSVSSRAPVLSGKGRSECLVFLSEKKESTSTLGDTGGVAVGTHTRRVRVLEDTPPQVARIVIVTGHSVYK